MIFKKTTFLFIFGFLLLFFGGCMSAYKKSLGGDTKKAYSKVFFSDFNLVWQSTLEALKSFPLDISNRESGYIQTRFIDNTSQKNFIDTFGVGQLYLKSRFRFRVSVAKSIYKKKRVIKVNIIKEQLIKEDVLEGWREVETDGLEENTLLYRVERLVKIQSKINDLEKVRIQKQLKKTQESVR